MHVYLAQHKSDDILSKSSSGGIFYAIASYVIRQHGVVFGAIFDEKFNVKISYTQTDFTPMLGSKYVKSSIGTSYQDCKHFLDDGRLVLYSGTPCQIYGLKRYLGKPYNNLITVDVICHGSPIPKIWQRYLKSFGKPIHSISFRDKRQSWEDFHLTIKFTDHTEFSESLHTNKYVQLFLKNKILCNPCYTCKRCQSSNADLTIGDAWGAIPSNPSIKPHKGTSVVLIRTTLGQLIFDNISVDLIREPINESYLMTSIGYVHNYIKPIDAERIQTSLLKPKIAILTIPGHNNIGNTLQAFALQSKIKELYPQSTPIVIHQHIQQTTDFFNTHVHFTSNGLDDTYDMMVVGSDQIWTDEHYVEDWGIPFDERFLLKRCKYNMVYAASFGKHELTFSEQTCKEIKSALSNIKYIGTREFTGGLVCKHYFGITHTVPTIDPTMLYDKYFYLNAIRSDECHNPDGIFAYILDTSDAIIDSIQNIANILHTHLLSYDRTVENFISNMNQAKYVITDSYHGSVFALLFNKPFVCIRNMNRGNDRFDDLSVRFAISDRFINTLTSNHADLLKQNINVADRINLFRLHGIQFLTKGLMQM